MGKAVSGLGALRHPKLRSYRAIALFLSGDSFFAMIRAKF